MNQRHPDIHVVGTATLALLCLAVVAHAEFVSIERFDGLLPGPIDGQGGWVAPSDSCLVVAAPDDPNNQVLSVITESTYLHGPLALPDGLVRMLFLRFRVENQLNVSFGLSDLVSPTRFDHFDVELSVDNSPMELRVNDAGTYRALGPVTAGRWYNCWIQVDNATNTTRVWLHDRPGSGATEFDRLDSEGLDVFAFRNTVGGDMQTFYIKTGGGNGIAGPLLIDDLFLEDTDALNLAHPVPGTAAIGPATPAGRLALEAARPNPFRSGTNLRFVLPRDADVDLAVYDVGGRRVATLVRGALPAGTHDAAWDGESEAGGRVTAGVYFVRLACGPESASRRIAFLP